LLPVSVVGGTAHRLVQSDCPVSSHAGPGT
jgi:hypothetical protein